MNRSTIHSAVRHAAVVAVLVAALAFATGARADDGEGTTPRTSCGPNQTTMLEQKTCPPTNRRPAVVVQRACCTRMGEKGTKTRCKSFPHCPRNSPS